MNGFQFQQREPAGTGHKPQQRRWAGLIAIAFAGLITASPALVACGSQAPSDPAQVVEDSWDEEAVEPVNDPVWEAAVECQDDFAWAVALMAEGGDSGFYEVNAEWGSADGRVHQALQFANAYLTERQLHGRDAAGEATRDLIFDYCYGWADSFD